MHLHTIKLNIYTVAQKNYTMCCYSMCVLVMIAGTGMVAEVLDVHQLWRNTIKLDVHLHTIELNVHQDAKKTNRLRTEVHCTHTNGERDVSEHQ